jgi:hypothetical protein
MVPTGKPLDEAEQYSDLGKIDGVAVADRVEALLMAALICEVDTGRRPLSRLEQSQGPSGSRQRSRQFLRNFHDRFCGGYVTGEANALLATLPSGHELLDVQALASLDEAEAATVGEREASRLLENTRSTHVFRQAGQYLLATGNSLPQARRLRPPETLRDQALINAQVLAIDMAGCRIRGGCGVDGLYTMVHCGPDSCAPGRSLEQVWRERFLPVDFEYAHRLSLLIEADLTRPEGEAR